ncbi:unnamed protein product [Allacma fusca]|uniref:Uncharacterized protein n=1 Tax=Allacma fusca TaxID=39272 RepID=A0A8J2PD70_9HEXA|nr:unnamed protein product [Allacma fusca]
MAVRWNSTIRVLQRYVYLQKALAWEDLPRPDQRTHSLITKASDGTIKSDSVLSSLTLTEAKWTFVKGIVTFLEVKILALKKESRYVPGIINAAESACEKLNVYYPKTDGLLTFLNYWKSHHMTSAENVFEDANDDDLSQRQIKEARFDSRNDFEKYLSGNPSTLVEDENGVLSR